MSRYEVQCVCAKPQRIATAKGTLCGRCWMWIAPARRIIDIAALEGATQ